MMDLDLDFNLAPSNVIYGERAVKLDPTTQGACLLGSKNALCIGVTPQQSENAPGLIGNNSYPYIIGQPDPSGYASGTVEPVPVYGPGRKCLIAVDPAFAGQIKPGDLVISSDSGYGTLASPFGPWNQWVIGISLAFANANQTCNIRVTIFPWAPTGS